MTAFRFSLAALLLALPVALVAEEATVAATSSGPVWLPVVMSIVTAILAWVGNMMRKKFNADAENAQLDATKTLMENKNFIIDKRLIPFAIGTAEHWLVLTIPKLVMDAADGDGFKWKEHWSDLLGYTKERVLQKFLAENVDIIKMMGERELDALLDRLALNMLDKLPEKVSKFVPEATVLKLTDKVSEFAVEKGQELLTKYLPQPAEEG